MNKPNRLRFAPSPTGDLHIGGARAALFNWLYARKTGGTFLLRIEDTDAERSTEVALKSILDSLQWLGLNWDEEPVRQSQRVHLYRTAVKKLLANGAAYRCFCTREELEAERERARLEKLDYYYSGKCRNLDAATIENYMHGDRPYAVRFHVPPGESSWEDLVHETTTFQNETIGDFIIARTDGSPVYVLGVAVDDADMGITLVMRGDDHISNTPKQIMLMKALGSKIPRFAHLPQVLGYDKKKLSKRHGAASVLEYRRMGFLPSAVVNFLAFLGWNPGDDREKMSLEELIEAFSIEGISKKSSVFDIQKLTWLNGQYLKDLSSETLLVYVCPLFVERGYVNEFELEKRRDYILQVVRLLKERCRLITDFPEQAEYFFVDPELYERKGVKKHFDETAVADRLDILAVGFEKLDEFTGKVAEEAIREFAEKLRIGTSKLIHPIRLAVTGVTYGPGLFELLEVIGREKVVSRMRKAAAYIRQITT
ncbi:MAG TPA: glutamate--tRNA ligase [Anaerolineae bacterium]|nr:glutamate--tRNA ligase [Anaerolineae bacterium]